MGSSIDSSFGGPFYNALGVFLKIWYDIGTKI